AWCPTAGVPRRAIPPACFQRPAASSTLVNELRLSVRVIETAMEAPPRGGRVGARCTVDERHAVEALNVPRRRHEAVSAKPSARPSPLDYDPRGQSSAGWNRRGKRRGDLPSPGVDGVPVPEVAGGQDLLRH